MEAGKGLNCKSFIVVMLVLGLVLVGQHNTLVEARSCCPSSMARHIYNACRFHGDPPEECAKASGCKLIDGKCGYPDIHHSLHSNSDEANALEFCKLGCASSSLCDNIKASDVVDRCDEACYRFCTKHVHTSAATTTVVS